MKKVLLIGNGAREHVIGETLKKAGAQVFTYGKVRNPGLIELSEDYFVGGMRDFGAMRDFALKVKPDFAFIGPDDPIADGVADMLLELDIRSVAPLKTVARLESSKSFTRDLVKKYGIAGNPDFKVFFSDDGMGEFLRGLGRSYVVKADGLMGGKGVKVSGDHLADETEGLAYAVECLQAAGRVIIEEKLVGQEFSLMSFCDGVDIALMPAVQDHKRAFNGDKGPNTGGMGSYSAPDHLLPFLSQKDIDKAAEIIRQVAAALFKETGCEFKGIMYGGFIATASGVKLIEFNARFGDPEAMNVLPILNTNFVHVCEAIIEGDLASLPVKFENKATVCKYIVPQGYPDNPRKGEVITIEEMPADVRMYYASVDQTPAGLMLSSSRAVGLVGIADTIEAAEKLAAGACDRIKGPVFYRSDIGTAGLIESRVKMMKELRSGV
ncbi:phosphoribosylamine--glycine ligase [Patescibacteria group bacterium]|nr:phosphoribosylamine--glycine ligase [Patescibacteria group bacterium]MBU1703304.1 phosphoribosylamine--glycine ligase [Patescibacteria group bacterium]MBU1954377.1 phosphoribosylamine--glycine ligase [Patescibacteria group bacterium]